MAETFETFEIDDDFDPLEDLEPQDAPADKSELSDYQMPEDGDEGSFVVEEESRLVPRERIPQLIDRMPGQKARLLAVVSFCEAPRTLEEISAHLADAFPTDVSVYGPDRLVALLERAGAIARSGGDEEGRDEPDGPSGRASDGAPAEEARSSAVDGVAGSDLDCLTVEQAKPCLYEATEDGRAFSSDDARLEEILGLVREDGGRYAPLYREILELTAPEEGCSVSDINARIDTNPLCERPRRFATYFLNRMERAGGVSWSKTWHITEHGRRALASDELACASQEQGRGRA